MIDLSGLKPKPGVYVFKDTRGVILYVGKAVNLTRRVKQYFQKESGRNSKTLLLVSQIASVETIETASEFDALLLEAKLISLHKPKYNSIAKDDKSPLYVCLTLSESLPRVLYLRGSQLTTFKSRPEDCIFGPFGSARVARSIMRDIRRSVPFCTQKRRDGRLCFYSHLGLCTPCASCIAKRSDGDVKQRLTREYRLHFFRLKDILSGKAPAVTRDMEREMKDVAKRNLFEQAQIKKRQIEALYELFSRHYDVSYYIDEQDALAAMGQNEQDSLAKALGRPIGRRIEGIDISNTSGSTATGSLIVAQDGIVDTTQYRKFRIRTMKTPNDVAMMEEVLKRRFKHAEWPYPDLLFVDGGKPQLGRALAVLSRMNISIPVIGLAKRREEIYTDKGRIRLPLTSPALHLLQRIRDEAHRFALSYHRKLRNKRAFATIDRT
ncbi:MAG: GIY-YIG nuclease family protein [Patescibacteria group bacterium]